MVAFAQRMSRFAADDLGPGAAIKLDCDEENAAHDPVFCARPSGVRAREPE
jgi:hypothetical protein